MASKNTNNDYIESSSSDSEQNSEVEEQKAGEFVNNIKSILKSKDNEQTVIDTQKKAKLARKEVKFIGNPFK